MTIKYHLSLLSPLHPKSISMAFPPSTWSPCPTFPSYEIPIIFFWLMRSPFLEVRRFFESCTRAPVTPTSSSLWRVNPRFFKEFYALSPLFFLSSSLVPFPDDASANSKTFRAESDGVKDHVGDRFFFFPLFAAPDWEGSAHQVRFEVLIFLCD